MADHKTAAGNSFPAAFLESSGFSLSCSALKIIAIICMLIDHIAWAFVPTASILGQLMHTLGRITAPTICFLLTIGYQKTRDFKKYLIRLALFTVLSYFPFLFFLYEALPSALSPLSFNMLYTLTLCLIALWVDEHVKEDKIIYIFGILLLSVFGDWPVIALLFTLNFSRNRFDRNTLIQNHCLIVLIITGIGIYGSFSSGLSIPQSVFENFYELGMLLPLPLIDRCSGAKGAVPFAHFGKRFSKYFFYSFYPIHLAVIAFIKYILTK